MQSTTKNEEEKERGKRQTQTKAHKNNRPEKSKEYKKKDCEKMGKIQKKIKGSAGVCVCVCATPPAARPLRVAGEPKVFRHVTSFTGLGFGFWPPATPTPPTALKTIHIEFLSIKFY